MFVEITDIFNDILKIRCTWKKCTKMIFFHISYCIVAAVVHNYVHDNSDAVLVSSVNQSFKLLRCTEVCVCFGIVKHIIAVIWIVRKVAIAWVAVSVSLLIRSGNPQCIYAEVAEISLLDSLCNTCKVTAVECARSSVPAGNRLTVFVECSAVWVVVWCVAVFETVSKHKVNCCIVPSKTVVFNNRACYCRTSCFVIDRHSRYIDKRKGHTANYHTKRNKHAYKLYC